MGPLPTRTLETVQASFPPRHAAEIARRLAGEGNWEVEETTTYDAAFNVAIEPADLRFIPPELA
jgi:hypothetical protein